ncbi:MAG TPA: hypothetical protein VNS22_27310 [Geminicoccus sp.]|uniref:hypothetical protein n=1 Tax=Geminicoccus sp. TaxID=2024832 RepID=UPI002CE7A46B|nr:hypothetical protein [Geminicoccus sp.]HWL72068.1 hypothetical protein [Geminicoccus sp.]
MDDQAQRDDEIRPAAWPALLFGGWWALSAGLPAAATAALAAPFLLLWHGRPGAAVLMLLLAHAVLATLAGRGRIGRPCRLRPLLLPPLVAGAALALFGLLGLLVGIPGGDLP